MTDLFSPLALGSLDLPNRIVMAPMTRSRSAQPGDVPTGLNARYYAQRASAGLIVTEATQISPRGKGYSLTPGIHSADQIDGWRLVTQAVHDAGGRIFVQLWHVGRMSHASLHTDGRTFAPSAIAPDASVWIADPATGAGAMQPSPVPHAMDAADIAATTQDFRTAARNAVAAGFDGVEIHGANGYLLDQFLRRSSNRRTDAYGGDIENRIRFPLEVAEAVAAEIGAERTGIRLSPHITERGMADDQIEETILTLAAQIDRIGLVYLHLVEADWDDAPQIPDGFRDQLCAAYGGRIIVAGRYDAVRAATILGRGWADLVAFGRPFVANPDLPHRLRHGLPLAEHDAARLFGGGERGYLDYPAFAASEVSA